MLFKIFGIESRYFIKRDFIKLIIAMCGILNRKHLFILASEQCEGILSKIIGVSLIAMHNQNCIFKFAGILKNLKFMNGNDDVAFHPSVEFPLR